MKLAMIAMTLAAGCSTPERAPRAAPADSLGRNHAVPARSDRFERPAMVAFHMASHFDDLREVERLAVLGRLEDARSLAYMLEIPTKDPGLTAWRPQVTEVRDAVRAFRAATEVRDAVRLATAVGAACARCHAATNATVDTIAPAERRVDHAAAADQLWSGLIDPSGRHDRAWRDAIDELATDAVVAHELQDKLGPLRDLRDTAARATGFGELLVACASCHARGTRHATR